MCIVRAYKNHKIIQKRLFIEKYGGYFWLCNHLNAVFWLPSESCFLIYNQTVCFTNIYNASVRKVYIDIYIDHIVSRIIIYARIQNTISTVAVWIIITNTFFDKLYSFFCFYNNVNLNHHEISLLFCVKVFYKVLLTFH